MPVPFGTKDDSRICSSAHSTASWGVLCRAPQSSRLEWIGEIHIYKLQNFFTRCVLQISMSYFASQQHPPRDHPALSFAQLQADLNNLEQSVDVLQNNFNEVYFTNQQNVAPQHWPIGIQIPNCKPRPNPCNYIRNRYSYSGLILQYKSFNDYTKSMVIENYNSASSYISSGMCSSPVFLSTTTLRILLLLIHS